VKCTVCALSPWQDAVLTKMLLEGYADVLN